MQVHVDSDDQRIVILKVDAQINQADADALIRDVDAKRTGDAKHVIVDCDDLDFLSSAGIGNLLQLHKHIEQQGGGLRLAKVNPMVGKVFSLMKLDRIFKISDSLDKARTEVVTG